MTTLTKDMPNKAGYFGEYGGQIIPPELIEVMNQITRGQLNVLNNKSIQTRNLLMFMLFQQKK